MDSLQGMQVVCAVAERLSFRAAADHLSISTAMASKHVANIERRLGVRLFNRSSRHVSLTEAGQIYCDSLHPLLDGLTDLETAVKDAGRSVRGTLRISAPVWMANPHFAAVLTEIRARHPGIEFDIDLSGRIVNLVEEGYDLALRVSNTLDPGIIARPLADVTFQLVASSEYLQRTGFPGSLEDLQDRELLTYSMMYPTGQVSFASGEQEVVIRMRPVVRSGNESLLRELALAGMGMAMLPNCLCEADFAAGRLVPVLTDEAKLYGPLYAVYPSRKYLSAKVRTFLEHFTRIWPHHRGVRPLPQDSPTS